MIAARPLTAESEDDTNAPKDTADSSATTSSDEDLPAAKRRVKNLQSCVSRRKQLVKKFQNGGRSMLGDLSFLEDSAVMETGASKYAVHVTAFFDFADEQSLALDTAEDAVVDGALVSFFNQQFLLGKQASVGEQTLAGLQHFFPEFGRYGARKTPRTARALKGWRRRAPPRSRKPWPWIVWAGIAWDLARRGFWLMAVHVLFMVVTYSRPSAVLDVRRGDLLPPIKAVSAEWGIILNPQSRKRRSKTGVFDDSMSLTNRICPWFPQIAEALADGPADERILDYSYDDFTREFRRTCKRLRLADLVPYQARHSGASIDFQKKWRSFGEIKKRGRWRQDASVARYERAARLAATARGLDSRQLDYCNTAAKQLEALFFGRASGDQLALP